MNSWNDLQVVAGMLKILRSFLKMRISQFLYRSR